MKPESRKKIDRIKMKCLSYAGDFLVGKKSFGPDDYKQLVLEIDQKILIPEYKLRPQEKNLVETAAKEFIELMNDSIDKVRYA